MNLSEKVYPQLHDTVCAVTLFDKAVLKSPK